MSMPIFSQREGALAMKSLASWTPYTGEPGTSSGGQSLQLWSGPSDPSHFDLALGGVPVANFELNATVSGYGDDLHLQMSDTGETAFLRIAGCYLFCSLPVGGMIE